MTFRRLTYLASQSIGLTFALGGAGCKKDGETKEIVKEKLVQVQVEVPVPVPVPTPVPVATAVASEILVEVESDQSAGETKPETVATAEVSAPSSEPAVQGVAQEVQQALALPGADKAENLAVVGTLAISNGDDFGFGLAEDPKYQLYCATFSVPSRTCLLEVDAKDKFKAVCDGFAGSSFGCFVRRGDETVSIIDFDGRSSVTAGAGVLAAFVFVDLGQKTAKGLIDAEHSTAFTDAAVDEALKATGGTHTSLPDLSGSWRVTCVEAEEKGLFCDDLQGVPPQVFLRSFVKDETSYIAVWKDRARHDICIPEGTSEFTPSFGMALNTVGGVRKLAFDYSATDALATSLDAAYGVMASDFAPIKERIDVLASVSGKMRECDSKYSEARCKVALELYDASICADGSLSCKASILALEIGQYESIAEYEAEGLARELTCAYFATEDFSVCPSFVPWESYAYAPEFDNYLATYTGYVGLDASGAEIPLTIACRNANDNGLVFERLRAAVETQQITLMNDSDRCNIISDATSPFVGKRFAEREGIHDAILDLASMGQRHYQGFANLCLGLAKPAVWDFRKCEGSYEEQSEFNICHPSLYGIAKNQLGMKVDDDTLTPSPTLGKLIVNADVTPSNTYAYADTYCPAARATYDTGRNALDQHPSKPSPASFVDDLEGYYTALYAWIDSFYTPGEAALTATLDANCRIEFAAISVSDQIERLTRIMMSYSSYWPDNHPYRNNPWEVWTLIGTICSLDAASAASITGGAAKSCVPNASLDTFDSSSRPLRSLRCNGASGGACFNDGGVFVGDVPDKLYVARVDLDVNQAFQFLYATKDAWFAPFGAAGRPGYYEKKASVLFTGAYGSADSLAGLYKVQSSSVSGIIAGTLSAGKAPALSDSQDASARNLLQLHLDRCADDACAALVNPDTQH